MGRQVEAAQQQKIKRTDLQSFNRMFPVLVEAGGIIIS